ncbi:hypothetical protein YC2023_026944 [Brassica napus]
MALPPGLYSGTSSLALVARASAFSVGLLYGSMKLKVLKVGHMIFRKLPTLIIVRGERSKVLLNRMTKKPHKVEATAHH